MQKVYSRINWENDPSTNTPLSEDNLNKIDYAIDQIDNRVVNLGGYQERAAKSEANAKSSETNAKTSEVNAKQSELLAKQYMESAFSGTPEGYAALLEQVERMDIKTSTALTYPNTKPGGLRLLEMTGKTKQKTLSGKNLFDIEGWLANLGIKYTKNNNTITVTTADNPSGISLIASPSKAYKISEEDIEMTVSVKSISGLVSGVNPRITIVNSNGTIVKEMGSGSKATVVGNRIMINYSSTDITGAGVSISDVQVERGSIVTPYEPYCGGTPSPNPEYPQAIENVGDCVEMMQGNRNVSTGAFASNNNRVCNKHFVPCKSGDVVKIEVNKNLPLRYINIVYFNSSTVVGTKSNTTNVAEWTIPSNITHFCFDIECTTDITPQTVGKISLTVNGKHVVQFVEHGKNKGNFIDISVYASWANAINLGEPIELKAGTYTLSWEQTETMTSNERNTPQYKNSAGNIFYRYAIPNYSLAKGKYSWTFTLNDDDVLTFAYWIHTPDVAVKFINFQLEEGSTATDYEPYTEKVATIFLDDPLREGDRLVKVDGVWNENYRRATVVFDGSDDEEWAYEQIDYASTIITRLPMIKPPRNNFDKTGKTLCDKFIQFVNDVGQNRSLNTFVLYMNKAFQIYLPSGTFTDLASGKEWLANNPITVEYELAEETYTPLDTQSQIALNGLETFNGVTYLEVDSKIKPSGIEVEYGTSQVGAYTLKCMNDNDTDRVERAELKARLDELAVALVSQ